MQSTPKNRHYTAAPVNYIADKCILTCFDFRWIVAGINTNQFWSPIWNCSNRKWTPLTENNLKMTKSQMITDRLKMRSILVHKLGTCVFVVVLSFTLHFFLFDDTYFHPSQRNVPWDEWLAQNEHFRLYIREWNQPKRLYGRQGHQFWLDEHQGTRQESNHQDQPLINLSIEADRSSPTEMVRRRPKLW